MYETERQLKYKCKKYDRELYYADQFFPSSKQCSNCKNINKNLTLSDREYVCPNCKSKIQRDYNSALNLKNLYIEIGSGISKLRLAE